MEAKIVKVTDKGQISLPTSMRENAGIDKGDELIMLQDDGIIIIEKATNLTEKFKDDLEFARKTEEAWKEIESGKGKNMSVDEFFKEFKKW